MFDVMSFRVVFSDSLSKLDELVVRICGPSVHHGISASIINDINRAKKKKTVRSTACEEVDSRSALGYANDAHKRL
jgi:hypothetical protein